MFTTSIDVGCTTNEEGEYDVNKISSNEKELANVSTNVKRCTPTTFRSNI